MMKLLHVYRKLDALQQRKAAKVCASVLLLALCTGYFVAIVSLSYSLNAQRGELVNALSNQSLTEGDELAVSLHERGEVFVNGRTYKSLTLLRSRDTVFDEEGNIASPQLVADAFLADQRPSWAPRWMLEDVSTTWMLAIVTTAWLLLIVWISLTLPFVLTLVGTAIPVGICLGLGADQLALAIAGIGVLTFSFVLLVRISLVLLAQPLQVFSVAHTVVKEASRTRIALVFIILLLMTLPLLPIWLDPESPLRFRIQTFLSRSFGLTFAIAACMTLFLSCASVAFEIRDRQIWQLMTKPLGRLNYLLGKWLGVMTVNVILLIVAGLSTFTFVQYLKQQPVARGLEGELDALAVRNEVLTARMGTGPDYEMLTPMQLRERVDQVIKNTPDLAELDQVPLNTRFRIERELTQTYSASQRQIPAQSSWMYIFSGLQEIRGKTPTMSLSYKFHILGDDEHETFSALFVFLDEHDTPLAQRRATFVPTMTHSFPVTSNLILEDGTVRMAIVNMYDGPVNRPGYGSLNFEEDGLELLYTAGTFEANFVKAAIVTWVKLAFLAALGVCASTLLSFPVACLLSFTVFLSGMIGPFLAEALEWYYPADISDIDWGNISMVIVWAFESMTRAIAQFIVFMLSSFGEYRPTQNLVEGRLIEWADVGTGMIKLGLLWSGIAMIFGYLVMRNRQLAIYSGHG